MLPRFRPATLSDDAQLRPSIRPVKPAPPPSPPSPGRRNASGFGPRGLAPAPLDDDDNERATAPGLDEPSTLGRGPETHDPPTLARGDAVSVTFEDETQARPLDGASLTELRNAPAGGGAGRPSPDLAVPYDALPSLEVRAPYDTYEAAFSERDPVTQAKPQYESAQVRRSDRAAHREPSYNEPSYPVPTDFAPERDSGWGRDEESGPRERPVADAPGYASAAPPYDEVSDSVRWERDQGAQPPAGAVNHAPPDLYEPQSMLPAPQRVPDAMHPAFVHGVQPIRSATPPDAWGTPHANGASMPPPMQAMHSSMPPAYAQQGYNSQPPPAYGHGQPGPYYGQPPPAMTPGPGTSYPVQQAYPGPHFPAPMPMHAGASGQMPSGAPPMMNRAQPVGAQVAPGPTASGGVGRFAWFVAGAAFGITFAFFATGFFSGGRAQSDFPAAPPLPPAAVQPAPPAPEPAAPPVAAAPAAPPVAPPVAAAPAAPPVAPPVAAAPVAPPVAVPPVAVAPPPPVAPPPVAAPPAPAAAAAPVVPAEPAPKPRAAPPPRRASRPAPPRRPAAPVSKAPKNLGGGGPGADPEPRSAPPESPLGGELGDLLGAGLKP